jgi:hypothetical protein
MQTLLISCFFVVVGAMALWAGSKARDCRQQFPDHR